MEQSHRRVSVSLAAETGDQFAVNMTAQNITPGSNYCQLPAPSLCSPGNLVAGSAHNRSFPHDDSHDGCTIRGGVTHRHKYLILDYR